tara:strand:- start:7144 stop:7356 length:213 start_codon:yes stop_codon:yes gene_type:complete
MTDISANYLMLKGELYEHCKNYNELKTFAINKLKLKEECIKFNETLVDNSNNIITESKLKEMVADALKEN